MAASLRGPTSPEKDGEDEAGNQGYAVGPNVRGKRGVSKSEVATAAADAMYIQASGLGPRRERKSASRADRPATKAPTAKNPCRNRIAASRRTTSRTGNGKRSDTAANLPPGRAVNGAGVVRGGAS